MIYFISLYISTYTDANISVWVYKWHFLGLFCSYLPEVNGKFHPPVARQSGLTDSLSPILVLLWEGCVYIASMLSVDVSEKNTFSELWKWLIDIYDNLSMTTNHF